MSKKRKRQVRKVPVRDYRPSTPSFSISRPARDEFTPDYSHVVNDLKRIGMLAGSFVLLLVVLSFIIH